VAKPAPGDHDVPEVVPGGATAETDTGRITPAATARAGDLLALDSAGRGAAPVRDMAGRMELLVEWLTAAIANNRRLPGELTPALLEAGRRHRQLRPLIAPVAGPLAGWLAAQRPDWSFASAAAPADSTVDDPQAWELGRIEARAAYLRGIRRRDPAAGRDLLVAGWDAEPPDDRAALLTALAIGLSADDEPLLERALDDRRRQVRNTAHELLGRLPDSAYAHRMTARAHASVQIGPHRTEVRPPVECDAPMRRDGIAVKPPAGTGERAWWLEEILARTPLRAWPAPDEFRTRPIGEAWASTVRRGLARAAAAQQDATWAGALVRPLAAEVAARGRPDDRLLLESLYEALPPDELAALADATLRGGLAGATAVGVEHVLALLPRPWPPAVAAAVFGALAEQVAHRGPAWRLAGICELAALRLPVDLAIRAAELAEQLRATRPRDPGVAVLERLATALRYRLDMLQELA
jgi:hypothetical protein